MENSLNLFQINFGEGGTDASYGYSTLFGTKYGKIIHFLV